MPLFQTPKRSQVNETELVKKVNSSKKSEPTLKLGKNSLLTAITNIKTTVETKLGKYKEKYLLITNPDDLHNYIDKILENGICALDTETTGLNCFQDKIVGFSIYTPGQKAIYVPVRHISYITNEPISSNIDFKRMIFEFNRLSDKSLKIIYHNAKFDYKMILNDFKISLPIFYDTMLAARCIKNDESVNLKYQNAKYVEETDEFAKFSDLFDNIPFQYIPVQSGYIYAAKDAEMTYNLWEYQQRVLKNMPKVKWLIENIEIPCIMATVELELNGVYINQEYAKELHTKYQKKLDNAMENAYNELAKYNPEIEAYKRNHPNHSLSNPINLSSPKQLAVLFYDIMKLPAVSKKEPRGTGEEILVKWKNKFCEALLEYRTNKKLMSTYIEAIPSQVEADGRIHCLFNQYGTDTGRFSSSEPNLQNIPSHNTDIRPMFSVPEGYCLVGSDFSQQEVRLMAAMCKDENMIQAYKDNKDVYAWVASMIYKMPYEECKEFRPDGTTNKEGKQRRSNAKAIVLGINYSKGAKSIAEDLGITEKEAQNIYNTFFREFPKVRDFISNTQEKVKKLGYTETLFGRRRQLPDMQLQDYEITRSVAKPKNFDPTDFDSIEELDYSISSQEKKYWENKMCKSYGFMQKQKVLDEAKQEGIIIKENVMKKADAERQCVNAVIQGTASDQTKLSLIKLVNNNELKRLGFKICLIVHDEILGECPIQNAKRCGEILTDCMAHSLDGYLDMTFKCDAEYSKSWYGESININ